MRATPPEIVDWRDMAISALRQHGRMSPEELGDATGEHRNAVVIRAKLFKSYFSVHYGLRDNRTNRDRVIGIELVEALRTA